MNPTEYSFDDNIVAIATALAPAALAIIRTSGKNCTELLSKSFSNPKALKTAKQNTTIYGWIQTEQKQKIDEVILCIYKAPKSFTGEDAIEIICHGGVSVALEVYTQLIKTGFRKAEGGEFTFRSFINGKIDLTKAEAVKEIIDAKTGQAANNAAKRLSGNITTELQKIKQLIMHALAGIQVEIEYPEDEETTENAFDSTSIKTAQLELKKLADSWAGEKIYQEGAKIVLAGKTNAGKSLLFNTLLKEDRSIVSDIHGTTRDWIDAHCNINGIPAKIYDTAGIRLSTDAIEQKGIERSKILLDQADLIFYLLEANKKPDPTEINFLKTTKTPTILVRTKIDIAENTTTVEKSLLNITEEILISAKTTEGISKLSDAAYKTLTTHTNKADSVSLGTERQKIAVLTAHKFLQHALDSAEAGFPLDAVAQDLEESLLNLAEITGEIKSDDILNQVFSDFCVGK